MFRAREVEAVDTAVPTGRAHELIIEWHRSGRIVGIVSNNSAAAVRKYQKLHRLESAVQVVAARTSSDPNFLKPSAHLVRRGVGEAGVDSARSTLIGDSPADIQAAQRAGVTAIGYVNKPVNLKILSDLHSNALMRSVSILRRL
ncbi:HAD family hydrolase [Saccharothrix saharensis]|uniref:HAD family hydrolase n=1 Tax=Saccharothrix saharensis TaxID=571190 RepID=UPI003CCC7ACD